MQLMGQLCSYSRQAQESGKKIRHYTYNYSDLIGQGNFSKVYKGVNTKTKEIVAIKIVSLDDLKSKHLEQLVFEEINILQQLDHPNILKFHEALLSERNCYIITQLCDGGNLEDRIANNRHFSEGQLSKIISDVFQGLKYLKQMGVCHRDIKSANIFLKGGQAKIADFGLAKFYKQLFKDLDIGSPLYMSPEGLIHNVYGQKTDIWAFGVVIYELLHGKTPFIDCQTEIDIKTAVSRPIPEYKFNPNIPTSLRQLINSLLTIQEQRRPSVQDLQLDPYIKGNSLQENRPRKQSINNGLNVIQSSKISKANSKSENCQRKTMETSQKPIQLGGGKSKAKKKCSQEYQKNYPHLQATNQRHKQPTNSMYSVNQFPPAFNLNAKRVNTMETSDSEKVFFRTCFNRPMMN